MRPSALMMWLPLVVLVAGCDDLLETADTADPPGMTGPGGWEVHTHPCTGNRTDTMLWEGQTVWVGCGTTTTGFGLFRSQDGGRTWVAPSTQPAGLLEAFRVTSLQRSADGLLYVAGIDTLGPTRVVRLDTSAEPYEITEVFASMGQTWNSFHVGTFLRNAQGAAVAESLTGVDVAFRPDDAGPWTDAYGWWPGSTSYQILDMKLHDDRFYGVGSTISQPPHVFLPPRDGAPGTFTLEPVQVAEGLDAFQGELWGIDVDAGGVIAGGVNQNRDVGMIFWGPLDGYASEAWSAFDVSTLHPDATTWIRGVCRNGSTLVGVGEFSSRSGGLILRSLDGGATFTEITPDDVPPVHRCTVFDDGRIAVAGANGWIGIHRP